MAINSVTNNFLRIDGIASGLDTENIVKQLMQAEKAPLNRLFQNKTLLEWRRDNYRDITNTLRAFRDQFMDILKPATNMRSLSAYKQFAVTSSNSSVVTATANADAVTGEHKITQVKSLATAANVVSAGTVTAPLQGTAAAALDFTGGNNAFNMTVDGVTKTINLRTSSAYSNVNDLATNGADGIQELVNAAFGAGKVTVSADGVTGKISFFSTMGTNKITLSNAAPNNALTSLGFSSGASNRINLNSTLETLASSFAAGITFDGSNNVTFKINNVDFSFNKSKTLNEVISAINSSSAGVEIKYSELTDKFTISSKVLGSGDNLTITNTGGTLFGAASAIKVPSVGNITSTTNGTVNAGSDAELTLDGNVIRRNSNTFTVDGVTYVLNGTYNDPIDPLNPDIKLSVSQDTDAIFENIKNFVGQYNELIGKINGELEEKYDRNYLPLTDEQKSTMKDADIKLWEDKAKTGLLRNDGILQNAVDQMRRAIYDSITDVASGITSIGITTSNNYKDRGKLIIDETQLREAIQNNPDQVQNVFSKTSSIDYSPNLTNADRTQRYNEEGIVNRLYDIIQDNIRTTRNASGQKGYLLEKAGVIGDLSEYDNSIEDEISAKEKSILSMQEKIAAKEEYYYQIFANLERMISQMSSQSQWLSQQFSSGK